MKTTKELRQDKASHWEAMKALAERAAAEKRDLAVEESKAWDEHDAAIEKINASLERAERYETHERDMAAAVDLNADPSHATAAGTEAGVPLATAAFRKFLTSGAGALSALEIGALQTNIGSQGGYYVAPQEFTNELIKFVDDAVFVRQKATKFQITESQSLGAPSLDTDPSDADWTSEIGAVAEDTSMAFGKRELTPHQLTKLVKASQKLLRLAPDSERLVRERLGYKFGVTQEKAFLLGSGSEQPLGVYVASATGISAGRDTVCGSTTAITADGLIDMKYALKGQYHQRAAWMFSRDAVKQIRKLKNATTTEYVWSPGLGGTPDTVLDIPYAMSEFNPNTFTTGQYVAILGDWSFYWIVDSLVFEVQRLVELYAGNNQVGFIGRAEVDGMPVLEEAFVRGKLA